MGLLNDLGQMLPFLRGFRLIECTIWLLAPSPFFGWLGPCGHASYVSQGKAGHSGLLSALPHYPEEEKREAAFWDSSRAQ
jgi:hypothetical protein